MADVAREANVSVTTVSYVIGGRRGNLDAARISNDTRRRVLDAIQTIGYQVNEPARVLRRRRTDRVLLLIDRLSSPYDQHFATDVEDVLNAHGLSLSIVVCPTLDRLNAALDMVPGGLADGAIILTWSFARHQDVLERYARQQVPMAILGAAQPSGFDVVAQDEAPALDAAVDHIVARGHRRIGFIGHLPDQSDPEFRLRRVRARLARHGLAIHDAHIRTGARDRNVAYEAALDLMTLPESPTAIFSASDTGAIAAIWAAHATGRRVPDDIAIVGCGNVDEGRITVPRLSSAGPVSPDFAPVAHLLIERLREPDRTEDRHLLIPWEFVPRESS
jgi:DNA-binding LacI/PurR family transcriptional regulator